MKIEELIGKEIKDIKCYVEAYDYEGSIPLEISSNLIFLSTEEIFEIPYSGRKSIKLETIVSKKYNSIFYSTKNETLWMRILTYFAPHNKMIRIENKKIKGQKIVAIHEYEEEYTAESCFIELESGYFIHEVMMAPIGTGYAGIWFF